MGLFSNPLGYAGYPPNPSTAQVVNSTVRAATLAEANAGVLTDVYISPATEAASVAVDFASPPASGFGSNTPRPVHATTLDSTLNTDLATAVTATAFGALNAIFTGGTQTASFFSANSSGGTQTFNVLTGTRAGFINLGTGAAAHAVAIGSSTAVIGFFGATPVVKQLGTTDLRVTLINLGLYTTGGATPLDLNGGTLTALQTIVTAPTVAGASPVVNNSRAGIASFTDTIANGAFGTLTITNSTITSTSVIEITPSNVTANSALSVVGMVPGAGTVAVRLFNAGSASTAGNNIDLHFHVLN